MTYVAGGGGILMIIVMTGVVVMEFGGSHPFLLPSLPSYNGAHHSPELGFDIEGI
jgi:hypothetical protein